MFTAISTFLKPYTTWIIGGTVATLVGLGSWLAVDLVLTKSALHDAQSDLKLAEQTIKAQERAIAAVDRVENYRTDINRILRTLNSRIMEAEGANQEVPPAVAQSWANGIDCLRDHSCDTGSPEDVSAP